MTQKDLPLKSVGIFEWGHSWNQNKAGLGCMFPTTETKIAISFHCHHNLFHFLLFLYPSQMEIMLNFSYPTHCIFSLKNKTIQLPPFVTILVSQECCTRQFFWCTFIRNSLVYRSCCTCTFPTSLFHKFSTSLSNRAKQKSFSKSRASKSASIWDSLALSLPSKCSGYWIPQLESSPMLPLVIPSFL